MCGVPAIAGNPREGSRLLRFWVKTPNTNSEIGTTRLARAPACATRATTLDETEPPRYRGRGATPSNRSTGDRRHNPARLLSLRSRRAPIKPKPVDSERAVGVA